MVQTKEERRKNDVALIQQVKQGNQIAFREIYLKYNSLVHNIIFGFFPSKHDCDDVSQEVWMLLIKRVERFSKGYFASWLKRMVINYCIDVFRKKRRRGRDKIVYDNRLFYYLDTEDAPDYPQITEQMYLSGFRYIHRLTPLQQKIILLIRKGHRLIDIAKMLKKPYGTCLPAFSSAIVKLRSGLVQDGTIEKKGLSLNLRKYK